jgi:hypothetical protein
LSFVILRGSGSDGARRGILWFASVPELSGAQKESCRIESFFLCAPLCPLWFIFSRGYNSHQMSDFDTHLEKVERTLGRELTSDELRLLKLWDLTAAPSGSAMDAQPGSRQDDAEPEAAEAEEYEGQFKIAFARGQYEVYFMCSSLRLKPVLLQDKEDVVWLLTQDPFYFDDMAVRQAVAAAEHHKPTLIGPSVAVQEVFLRSMGFTN